VDNFLASFFTQKTGKKNQKRYSQCVLISLTVLSNPSCFSMTCAVNINVYNSCGYSKLRFLNNGGMFINLFISLLVVLIS
jgi:hypothetical protein